MGGGVGAQKVFTYLRGTQNMSMHSGGMKMFIDMGYFNPSYITNLNIDITYVTQTLIMCPLASHILSYATLQCIGMLLTFYII